LRVGTKSVLFGFHQFLIHPAFVTVAWWMQNGIPLDPRLLLAIFVHDIGYLGKPNMDGPEGETHPEVGARIMRIFGQDWSDLVLLHSRFYCKRLGRPYSRLCRADKLAIMLYPRWLWKLLVTASGEIDEYLFAERYKATMHGGDLNTKWEMMRINLAQWLNENR
jgi:hypothetical protein